MVFFFMQKTASEMRISDWSSDVCSSDLDVSACAAAARLSMGHGGNTRLASSRKAFTHDQFAVESEPRTLGLAGSRRVTARTTIQPCDTSRTTGSKGNETNQSEVLETSLAVRPDDRRAASGRSEEHTSELQSIM